MLDLLCATILSDFYPINLLDSNYENVYTSRVENSVDPDQLASQKPADLIYTIFKQDLSRFSVVRVKASVIF